MKPVRTVHNGRTIMFSELKKVMDHALEGDNYLDSLNLNVINKATKSGITYTSRYLKRLYDFDLNLGSFQAFKHFWEIANEHDKRLLAILYAIGNDHILNDSIPLINKTEVGQKVTIESVEALLESLYPQKYTDNTRRSMAQNIASSWKQAGFITGKLKNLRTQPEINYTVVSFAFLLSYLNGLRGDFIIKSNWVKALCLDEKSIRTLALEAGKRDLLQYQFAGNVTSITFSNLLIKLNLHGIEN